MLLPKRNKIDEKKEFILYNVLQLKKSSYKPKGFWYSINDEWYNFIKENQMYDFYGNYIHKIIINNNIMTNIHNKNKNKLLVINNKKDLKLFGIEYGDYNDISPNKNIPNKINWTKVAKDYGGIELSKYYIYNKLELPLWTNSWDVSSGCIWNTKSIIKNTKIIYRKKNKKYIKIY